MERHYVEAVYEDGVLRLKKPLPVENGTTVRLTVYHGPSRAEQSYGLLRWTGSAEEFEYLARSEELDPNES